MACGLGDRLTARFEEFQAVVAILSQKRPQVRRGHQQTRMLDTTKKHLGLYLAASEKDCGLTPMTSLDWKILQNAGETFELVPKEWTKMQLSEKSTGFSYFQDCALTTGPALKSRGYWMRFQKVGRCRHKRVYLPNAPVTNCATVSQAFSTESLPFTMRWLHMHTRGSWDAEASLKVGSLGWDNWNYSPPLCRSLGQTKSDKPCGKVARWSFLRKYSTQAPNEDPTSGCENKSSKGHWQQR